MSEAVATRHRLERTTSANGSVFGLTGATASDDKKVAVKHVPTRDVPRDESAVESAIYAHLKAMRTLGHRSVNTADVAAALGLSRALVDRVVLNLRHKGVRVTGG